MKKSKIRIFADINYTTLKHKPLHADIILMINTYVATDFNIILYK